MSLNMKKLPKVVSHEEWNEARKKLLDAEKKLTRARDRLNVKRRKLPMVKVEKDYKFDSVNGKVGLSDMFEGRLQLLMQHFMFDPEWEDGCPSCTAGADEISDGFLEHIAKRDTTFCAVSRAPIEKIERYKEKRGYTFAWYSSFGSDFNYDFHVTIDPSKTPVEYNFRNADELKETGSGWMLESGSSEQPGHSVFLRVGDDVYHTYSMYARGAEWFGGSYAALDLTPLGRQEDWELPKGRSQAVREGRPDFAS
jgi:predicted dithiol-disulfide oxidoreductase (DUF899 family)